MKKPKENDRSNASKNAKIVYGFFGNSNMPVFLTQP